MYLYGEIASKKGKRVRVEIVTQGTKTPEMEIVDSDDGLIWFSPDPMHIDTAVNDTFDVLLRNSATIRLQSAIELTGLYCQSAMDATVKIYEDGRCIFSGYIEPQAYGQEFYSVADDVDINCIDCLSALQYSLYGGISEGNGRYEEIKMNANSRSFFDLIKEALTLVAGTDFNLFYDGSKAIEGRDIFKDVEISELLFIGKDENSVWTYQEVLEEILKYLGLHIEQEGTDFYIFSWDSAKNGEKVKWTRLIGDGEPEWAKVSETEISLETAADTKTSLDMGESFNLISLTCEITETENLIESPLDEENTVSPYPKRQLYVSTYSVPREYSNWPNPTQHTQAIFSYAYKRSFDLVWNHEKNFPPGDGYEVSFKDWYIRTKNNPNWKFKIGEFPDAYQTLCGDGAMPQEELPNWLGKENRIGAMLASFGYAENHIPIDDNSLVPSIEMKDYMVIGVWGNQDDERPFPADASLLSAAPVASYTGKVSGAVLTPSDAETTNYIVISGSLRLAPSTDVSFLWSDMDRNLDEPYYDNPKAVEWKNSQETLRYYTRMWWKTDDHKEDEEDDPDYEIMNRWWKGDETKGVAPNYIAYGLCPPEEDGPELFEYKYSSEGYSTDEISKLPVLACMLIIGDKCLVETGTDGQISDFHWVPFKEREQCADDDEYYAQSFTIGIDPKIGDKIIGPEYDIQNNISYNLGIEAEGTAIPIRHSDRLKGKVRFQILGPVNLMWDEITRRHKTWFRSVKWTTNSKPVLAHVQNIFLRDFEVKVYSDNGLLEFGDNCDLVYMSDTDEKFVNKKDDITFRINTALTTEERVALGVSDVLRLSTPSLDEFGLKEIKDTRSGESGKPEQFYVDEAYRECHVPKVELEHNARIEVNRFDRYTHQALPGKRFFTQGLSRDLREGETLLKLREIGND